METTKTQTTASGWLVVLTAGFYFFYEFIQMNFFNAINSDVRAAFNLNAPQLGQLASMYFYANALFLFPAGILLDRFSTKKMLLLAVTLCTTGTFIFALSTNYYLAAGGRFIVGSGASFCFLSCMRLASRWFPPRKMALVIGVVVTMAMTGGLVAQTPIAILASTFGWRTAVLIDAGLGVVVAFAILFIIKDRPPGSHEKIAADKAHLKSLGFWKSIGLAFLNPQNWYGGLYTSLMNLPVFLIGALWGIHYLVQVHHVTPIQASYGTDLFFLGVILGSPVFGWLSDNMGLRILPMKIGAVLSLIVMMTLLFSTNLSFFSLMSLLFLIGFVTSSQILTYPTIAELNPIALTTTATSVDSILIMSSGFIFQPLFGWVLEWNWDHKMVNGVAIYSPHDFLNAMMIMVIGFVVALGISFLIKETYCQSQA